jgi:hypothetical protein
MSQPIRYVGLDVSKQTIAVAVAEPDGSVVEYGDIANNPSAVRRLLETLSRDAVVKTAYEAGPTGCPLHRQLAALAGLIHRVAEVGHQPSPQRASHRWVGWAHDDTLCRREPGARFSSLPVPGRPGKHPLARRLRSRECSRPAGTAPRPPLMAGARPRPRCQGVARVRVVDVVGIGGAVPE